MSGPDFEQQIAGGTSSINCPHCHNPVEAVDDHGKFDDIVCPSCGSSFNLAQDQTRSWRPGKLYMLDKFELLEAVGRGAFGTVYRARDTELNRIVAVKLPSSGCFASQEDEDRFIREARSVAQLRHPGIVSIFETGRTEHLPYIVSEFVEGLTLADVITGRRFTFREASELVAAVADALQYAHDNGVVHRDVKPSNIMLDKADMPHLMDFGLARRDAGEITMTIDGQVLGTPAYMSPEQAAGQAHHVDGRSDVYSLGCIFYQLLTGELPFRGSARMLLHQVLNEEPRAPRTLDEHIPIDLETVCLKAMAKEPGRRYASASDFGADIRRWRSDEPILARPMGRIELAWRWACRPQRTRDAGVLGILLCSVGLLFLTTWLVYSWTAELHIDRPAEFFWQGAVINGALLLGILLGRKVIAGSRWAMRIGLVLDLALLAILLTSMGNWLPAAMRFRAGGVYDNAMVRITLFSIFASMALIEAFLLAIAIVGRRRDNGHSWKS